ncbi:MAG: Polysaccharide biosynthesis protein [Gaiellaceae bacterium]|jgi:O-antigen/teichoic acid export membrane protein|nr:Polysaccharide biosynthesis protein [Gaiellaceae bacterium]
MRSRLFWRRSAAAAGTYVSAALGFLGTVVALHVFSTEEFGRYALVLAATAFVQSLLDLTVEEALVKFGFRYTAREDWGRLRRLFESAIAFKLVGGVLGTALLLALAPVANSLLHKQGLTTPLLIGAFLPLAQCTENVSGVALILRGRYDIRAFFLFVSMALRLTAIAVGAPRGLTTTIVAIVVAQLVATAAISVAGWAAYRRFPRVQPKTLGDDRRDIFSFVAQSSVATAVISLTAPLALLVLGRVASTRQVTFFRAALSPQQAFAVVSAPARLILLTEQTRAWERGTRGSVFAGIRRYMLGMAAVAAVILPPLLVFTPEVAKLLFSAKNAGAVDATRLVILAGAVRMVYGWTKSFPVSIGRPSLRIWTHGLEMLVLVPLVGVLGSRWGATGAAAAVLISSVVFCAAWTVLFMRISREPPPVEPPQLPVDPIPLEAALP